MATANLPILDAGCGNPVPWLAIFSAAVVYHSRVDECRALRQFHRCPAENGSLVLNLRGYRWMLSRHDAAVHNVRRYTASGLSRLLQASGFRLLYLTYWNALLFPVMMITRKLVAGNSARRATSSPTPFDRFALPLDHGH